MTSFPDTSFLCALYREQDNSGRARAVYQGLAEALTISSAVAYEFRQSVRLQVYLHSMDRTRGFGRREGERTLVAFGEDLAAGALTVQPCDWAEVLIEAERISATCTMEGGHRSWDVLHVATAVRCGARDMLTFDVRQQTLARQCGLAVPSGLVE